MFPAAASASSMPSSVWTVLAASVRPAYLILRCSPGRPALWAFARRPHSALRSSRMASSCMRLNDAAVTTCASMLPPR